MPKPEPEPEPEPEKRLDQAQVLRQINALVVSPLPLLSVGTSPLVQKIFKREETRSGIPESLMNCVGAQLPDYVGAQLPDYP